ncbi:MAG: flagellar biosynthesis protein FlhA [Desulfatitalea sp. BRH_c12]|nr:MAG: flagellar biosynthesis protein FlhA [Desulfatitalea sp. BRH_c12]
MAIAQTNALNGRFAFISNNSDVALGFATMCILLVMIIPIPTIILDLFLTLNITLALMILLVGMYVLKPLEFSAFPSVLLLVTLFRLSLNIASTRLILLRGGEGTQAAGKVIMAFGDFVVGGNYVVGLIVFIILVVINFVVITKGAGRIAEVAARFTLDAMPGKQMSIDADLNAGLIDEHQARDRRQLIAKESEYYGAMDGANKFVRGDAIAGIIITLVNIVAGFAIGVFQNDMSFAEAARNYTLLTVGDGLVSQVPALIISTAAGIVVSRAGSESHMGQEIGAQLFAKPRALAVAGVILFVFGLIPGLPTMPFFIMALLVGGVAYLLFQSDRQNRQDASVAAEETQADDAKESNEMFKPLPPLDILGLEIGYGLIPLVDSQQDGELLERIKSIRRQIIQELGIVVPSIHIQDNMQLKPGEYIIKLKGNEVARGDLMLNNFLAMNPGNAEEGLRGIATKEPTYGIDAMWIKERQREEAIAKGYTVVDLATVMTTHISELIRRHAHELLGRQEVQVLLDALKETHPKAVDELVPNQLSLGGVVRVLQNLLMEQVSIRDLLTIVEAMADWAPSVKQLDVLTEHVRQAMARTITRQYKTPEGEIVAVSLGQAAERSIAEALQRTDHGDYLAMDPRTAQRLMHRLAEQLDKYAKRGLQPLVLCSGQIRIHVKKLVDRFIPQLVVLSYEEILPNVRIQSLGVAELTDED